LIRIRGSYEKLVEKSRESFIEDKHTRSTNFQVYRFNEIYGRFYRQIIKDTESKARRMEKLFLKLDSNKEVLIYRLLKMGLSPEQTAN
jgi:hypothetical protein